MPDPYLKQRFDNFLQLPDEMKTNPQLIKDLTAPQQQQS